MRNRGLRLVSKIEVCIFVPLRLCFESELKYNGSNVKLNSGNSGTYIPNKIWLNHFSNSTLGVGLIND